MFDTLNIMYMLNIKRHFHFYCDMCLPYCVTHFEIVTLVAVSIQHEFKRSINCKNKSIRIITVYTGKDMTVT